MELWPEMSARRTPEAFRERSTRATGIKSCTEIEKMKVVGRQKCGYISEPEHRTGVDLYSDHVRQQGYGKGGQFPE